MLARKRKQSHLEVSVDEMLAEEPFCCGEDTLMNDMGSLPEASGLLVGLM